MPDRRTFLPWLNLLLVVAVVGGFGLGLVPVAAEDAPFWPRFHGPQGDNISTATGLLKSWPPQGPKLLWTTRGIGEGFSSVTIADGRIYTAGNIGPNTVVTAMDINGEILWQANNGKAWTGSPAGSRGTPTVDGRRIYHESPHGDVACLDAKTGKRLWGLNILKEFRSKNITWALAESLLIDGDRVLCCPGGPETAVVALNKHTGRPVWKSPSVGALAGYSSPALVQYQGLRMVLVMTSNSVIGVSAESGELLWRFEHLTKYDENILMPIFHDGRVFVTSPRTGSAMWKISVQGGKASVNEVWRSKELDNQHGGVILLDGYLYGACYASNSAKWVCLDWKDGKMMYADRGVGRGSATCAEGMLYTLSERSGMGLVRATPQGHQLISQFRLPEGGKGPSWAHPVVCGGRLYIRHGDFLYVYDVRAK